MRLSLHKIDDKLVLSADQIIPLPEAESYQIEVRQKRREERISKSTNKDRSLFTISHLDEIYEQGFKKSDIGFFTVALLNEKNLIDNDVWLYVNLSG